MQAKSQRSDTCNNVSARDQQMQIQLPADEGHR